MHPNNNNHVPIHAPEEENLYTRHHSAHYYVQWVKESLMTRVSKFTCAMVLFVLFVAGLIAFILWLSLRPHRPRVYIADFDLISGSDQLNGSASITYNVTIRNSNRKIVVHYDSIHSTVYYKDKSLGQALIWGDPFDQEPKNTTSVTGSLTVTSVRWSEFHKDQSTPPGSVGFRLEVTSVMRFKIYSWDTKRDKMHANCDVAVGHNGTLLDSYRDKRCPVYFS